MAKKKASSKASRKAPLTEKQREQEVKRLARAATNMAMAEAKVPFDTWHRIAAEAGLKLWGGSMEDPQLDLVLELCRRSAEEGVIEGRREEVIQEGMRAGHLRRLPGGMIGIGSDPALESAKTTSRANLNCDQSAAAPAGTPSSLPVAAKAPSTSQPSPAWAVESITPPCDIGIPWDIEEDAPRWPDGTRMYHSDEETLTKAVAEVVRALHPSGEFDDQPHYFLSRALEGALDKADAFGEDGSALDDQCYLSVAFLAGVAWAKENHAIGKPPAKQEPWWSAGLLDLEPERKSAAEFRDYVGITRLGLDKTHPHLKEELNRVEFRAEKPSPELLAILEWRLVEEPAGRAAG